MASGIDLNYVRNIIHKLDNEFDKYASENGIKNTDYAKKQVLDKFFADGNDFVSLRTVQEAFNPSGKVNHSAFSIYVHLAKAMHLNLNYIFAEDIHYESDEVEKYSWRTEREEESVLLRDPGYCGDFYGYIVASHSRNEKRFFHFSLNLACDHNVKTPTATLRLDMNPTLQRTYYGTPYIIKENCIHIRFEHPVYPRYEFYLQYLPHYDGKLWARCGIAITSKGIPSLTPFVILNQDLPLDRNEIKGLLTLGSRSIHIPEDHLEKYPELREILNTWKSQGYQIEQRVYYELKENCQATIVPDYYDCTYSPEDFENVSTLLKLRALSVEFENLPLRYGYNNSTADQLAMQYLWRQMDLHNSSDRG